MNTIKITICIALSGCTIGNGPQPPPDPARVGEVVERDCGRVPSAPGWTVTFDNATMQATMSTSDMLAVADWRTAQIAWNYCVTTHP